MLACFVLAIFMVAANVNAQDLCHRLTSDDRRQFKMQCLSVGARNEHLYLMESDRLYRIPLSNIDWSEMRMALFDQGAGFEDLGDWRRIKWLTSMIKAAEVSHSMDQEVLYRLRVFREDNIEIVFQSASSASKLIRIVGSNQSDTGSHRVITTPDWINWISSFDGKRNYLSIVYNMVYNQLFETAFLDEFGNKKTLYFEKSANNSQLMVHEKEPQLPIFPYLFNTLPVYEDVLGFIDGGK